MKLSNRVKIITSIFITILLVWLLATQVKMSEVLSLLKQIPMKFLLGGFAFYILGHFFRTIRFKRLLNWRGSFNELFSVVCVHNFFINTLPARTGELSYLYLTKKKEIPLTKSSGVLIIARMLDIISIALILLVAVLFAGSLPVFLKSFSYLVAVLLAFCCFLLFLLVFFGNQFMSGVKKILGLLGLGNSKITKWIYEKGNEVVDSFKILKSKKNLFEHLTYSLLIWIVRFIFFYFIIQGLGLSIGILVSVIGVTLPLLSTFLPIQGFGGFGTIEVTWAVSFMSLGIVKDAAILSGFTFHIVFLIFTILTGLYGALVLFLSKN